MIGKLKKLPLREIWKHEAKDFSSWLAENLEVLNEVLDINLSLVEKNHTVGSFFIDVLAEDDEGKFVIIENQLERTDHDHLGKLITYLSSMDAKTAIWICSHPAKEHKKAIDWLNEASPADVRFYLLKLDAVQIGNSEPAPLFTIIAKPERETKLIGKEKKQLAQRHVLRKKFWEQLLGKSKKKTALHANISPNIYNWIGTGAGKSGLSYNYVITKQFGGCELYIDRGKGYLKLNKQRFDNLYAHRKEIEKSFGEKLGWDRLEKRRAAGIEKRFRGVGLYNEDKWDNLQNKMIDTMIRLEKALKPYIESLH